MKNKVKKVVHILFRAFTLPLYTYYLFGLLFFEERRNFSNMMQACSLFPGAFGEWIRKSILEWITKVNLIDSTIGFLTTFSDPRIKIGNGVYIGPKCDIGYVEIGKYTLIGTGVHIISGTKQHFFFQIGYPNKRAGWGFKKK